MARTTNQISDRFWTGRTGRDLRDHAPTVRNVATWLMTNSAAVADPYGLYACELDLAVMQLGIRFHPLDVIHEAVSILHGLDFIDYDAQTQFVWVRQLANFQILEGRWLGLKEQDWRVRSAAKWYSKLPDNPFLGPFFDLYGAYLLIPAGERREYSKRRPPEGASKPHMNGAPKPQDQDLVVPDLFGEGGGVGEGETKPRRRGAAMKGQRLARPHEELEGEFADWWKLYPKKIAKGDAHAAYLKLAPPFAQLMTTTQTYIDSEEWREREDGTAAIPNPATFLNGKRWEDTPTPKRISASHRRALGTVAAPAHTRPAAAPVTVWDEVVGIIKRDKIWPDRLGLLAGAKMGDVKIEGKQHLMRVHTRDGDGETGDAIETLFGNHIRRILKELGHGDVSVQFVGEERA